MLKNIGLIILCNLLMYFIIILVAKINERKFNKYSAEQNKDMKIKELSAKVSELEKKLFIQDILNHVNIENEINEKIYYVNKIIEKYKDEPIGYYFRGNLYMKFKKYEEAINDFDKTIQIDNNYKEAYRGKGVCLSRQGYYYEAIQNYKKAIDIDEK